MGNFKSQTKERLTKLEEQMAANWKLSTANQQVMLRLDVRTERMDDDIRILKTDVAVLKTDVAVLKTDVAELKTDVGQLKGQVNRLELAMDRGFNNINAQLETLRGLITRDEAR